MNFQSFHSYRTDVETALRGVPVHEVADAVEILKKARMSLSTVYIMGNGGSAATAGHFANDLVKMCGIRAISLSAMLPLVTAYGNDNGYENIFSAALDQFLIPHDVVIGISCSGESPNVVNGILKAQAHGNPAHLVDTIGLIGDNLDCHIAQLAPDALISVPFRDIRVQEDCHMVICHAIAGVLSRE